jgi:hypothetical protein
MAEQGEPMDFHPIANIFPMMGEKELQELTDDIRQNGLHEPIVLYEDKILDGRNRFLACQQAWPPYSPDKKFEHYEGEDPLGYVLSLNLHRRHLTASQRAALAAEIADMESGARTDLEPSAKLREVSQTEAAEKLDVSERYVQEAKKIQRESPEHFDQVKSGELSLQQAKREMMPKQDIVVEFAGKRINTLDDLLKAKTPDEELMGQIYDFNIAVAKASQLVDKLKKHPLSRVMQIMFDHPQLVQTLEWQAGIAKETSLYYGELMDERQKTPITESASHN